MSATTTVTTLPIAVAGLGRMGHRHALHLLHRTPRAHLVAVSSPDPKELVWAKKHLEPYGVTLYSDYDKMLEHEGLRAVLVASVTTVHAEQTCKAIDKGLHVLCEKPLSTSVEVSRQVVEYAKKHPHLKVMCGFSRRFDASYRDAWAKMDAGLIGRPSVIRSQTCDMLDPSGFFVAYAEFSGGIFVDCAIHDIDLTLWFFGEDTVPKSCAAVGITAVSPELRRHGDRDNAVGVVEFWGGRVAYYYASRMMAHGQEDATEVVGTEGKLSVNLNPQGTLVNVYEKGGIRREVPQNYYGRFEQAFVTEAGEFCEAVLEDKKVPLRLSGALKAVEIGAALQEALVRGVIVRFDENGKRIPDGEGEGKKVGEVRANL